MKLHATSFNSNRLVVLSLIGSFQIDVQEGFSLPKLETLKLCGVYFQSDDPLKNLISGCTMLREAIFRYCRITGNVHIHSSSLKQLHMADGKGQCGEVGLLSIDAPNLEYIHLSYNASKYDITLPNIVNARLDLHGWDNEVTVIHKFYNSKILRLCPETTLDPPTVLLPPLLLFQNVVFLEMDVTYGWSLILFMIELCPILETFILNNVFYQWQSSSTPDDKDYSLSKNDSDHPLPRCLSSRLRHVKIYDFVLTKKFLEVAGYFLQNTGDLRKMYISMRPTDCPWIAEDPNHVRDRLMKLCPDSDRFSTIEICLPPEKTYIVRFV